MTTLHGQIDASISLGDLRGVLGSDCAVCSQRESSHYTGGEYLRLTTEVADITFERVSKDEVLVGGDAEDHAALRALAWSATRQLAKADLRHRFELYGEDELLWAYFHHRWPAKRLWIGSLESNSSLAEGVAALARGAGAEVALRSFDRYPIADPLAALLADVGSTHDAAVWILGEDEGRETWVALESAVMSQRDAIEVSVYRAAGASVSRENGEALDVDQDNGQAFAIARDALPWAHVGHRRLLVVDDTFLIQNRGLVLAPDVPLHLLPGKWQQKTRIGVCTPEGQARTFDALVAIPFVDPPRPDRRLGYVITLPAASKDDVPAGSEIWFNEGAS